MVLAEVIYSISAISSLTVSYQPLPKDCPCCLTLILVPGAITHHPIYKALASQLPAMPIHSLNLAEDPLPSSPLLCPREHTCKEGAWF